MRLNRIKPRRSRPRPGRLVKNEMRDLRIAAFHRAGGAVEVEGKNVRTVHVGACECGCGAPITFEAMELAHVRGKRMWGDSLAQVQALRAGCHQRQHNPQAVPRRNDAAS